MYVITIQDSFEAVIDDVKAGKTLSELFWVARRHVTTEVLEFGHVTVTQNRTTVFSGDVGFDQLEDNTYSVLFGGDHYTLISPSMVVDVAARDVSAVALSANGASLIVGTESGSVAAYNTSTKEKTGEIVAAHLLEISGVWVMPSDKVVLTMGTDHHAKLWSIPTGAEAAKPARVFAKAGMLDAALIGRGRNFVTAGNAVDVWECGSGAVVQTWKGKSRCVATDAVTDVVPGTVSGTSSGCEGHRDVSGSSLCVSSAVPAPGLFDYSNTTIYVGFESGTVQQHTFTGIGAHLDLHSPVSALSACGVVAVGTEDGNLVVWNPKTQVHHTLAMDPNYAVEHILARRNGEAVELVVSNGPEMLLRVVYDGEFRTQHLVGFTEMFHVRLLHSNGHTVVAATRDQLAFYGLSG